MNSDCVRDQEYSELLDVRAEGSLEIVIPKAETRRQSSPQSQAPCLSISTSSLCQKERVWPPRLILARAADDWQMCQEPRARQRGRGERDHHAPPS